MTRPHRLRPLGHLNHRKSHRAITSQLWSDAFHCSQFYGVAYDANNSVKKVQVTFTYKYALPFDGSINNKHCVERKAGILRKDGSRNVKVGVRCDYIYSVCTTSLEPIILYLMSQSVYRETLKFRPFLVKEEKLLYMLLDAMMRSRCSNLSFRW